MSLINYFEDGFTPTDTQVFILNKLQESLEKKTKFIIISAPTGSGKSFITKTLSNYSNDIDENLKNLIETSQYNKDDEMDSCERGGCFCLTITKNLQDQYLSFFHDTNVFKGKSNYQCSCNEELDCECGSCVSVPQIKANCLIKKSCPYFKARDNIITNKFGVLNYSSFFKLKDSFKNRQFIVCDEASELEDELVNNFSLNLSYKELMYFGFDMPILKPTASSSQLENWIFELSRQTEEKLAILKLTLSKNKKDFKLLSKDMTKFKFISGLSNVLMDITKYWSECNYIIDQADNMKISIMPVYVYPLALNIFNRADTVILMSATIINHKKFAETLGITDYDYIESPSNFDYNKAPIYVINGNDLNYKNIDYMLPKLSKQINDICEFHKNDKGIIHTHTQKIADYVKTYNFNNDRFTIRNKELTNEEVLEIHKNKERSVIVSPSMAFGVDLKDDLARFQIIVKIPYLPLGSARIKKLATIDNDWYIMKMFNIFIQACGRGIRSTEDYCSTYVLDSGIKKLLLDYKHILPKYFIDRFV